MNSIQDLEDKVRLYIKGLSIASNLLFKTLPNVTRIKPEKQKIDLTV